MAEKSSEKVSEAPGKTSVLHTYDGGLASAEFVFPLKSIHLIIAGLPPSHSCHFMALKPFHAIDGNIHPTPLKFHKKQLHVTMFDVTILTLL